MKKNSYLKKSAAFSFFSNSFDEIFSESSSTSGTFPLFALFLPLYSLAVIRKVLWHVGVSESHFFSFFFALYQLNIECQLLFYQLLIRDKGQRERNLSHLVWNLVLKNKLFPKSTGAPRQVSNERRSLDLDALRWCSDGTRHVCIATSSPATRSPFSLSSL